MNNTSAMNRILHIIFTAAAFIAFSAAHVQAQTASDTRADSLQQAVDELSAEKKKLDIEKKNEQVWRRNNKYFNLGYALYTLDNRDLGNRWKSDFAFMLNSGRTFYLHRRPIGGMVKFGIDVTYLEVSYAKYSSGTRLSFDPDSEIQPDINLGTHQIDLSVQAGLSVAVNPIDRLKISAHCRFAPAASMVIIEDEFNVAFVPYVNFGGHIAWRFISVGVEGMIGTGRYSGASVNDDLDIESDGFSDMFAISGHRFRSSSVRFILGFHF